MAQAIEELHSELEHAFRIFGPGSRVAFLEDRGAQFDPARMSSLLEDMFRIFGPSPRVAFLEDRGAQLDPAQISSLLEDMLCIFGPASSRVRLLVERKLMNLEQKNDYKEAWKLAHEMYAHFKSTSGLTGAYHHCIAQNEAKRNTSALDSITKKLNLLSLAETPRFFRVWLASTLDEDSNPDTTWVVIRKADYSIRVQRTVLTYWSGYFQDAFSGRWPISGSFGFDKDDRITVGSCLKIFGGFVTTGIYEWTSSEDLEHDYHAAQYFGIQKLKDLLFGIL
ncbi:uncharacterized protein F5Z01DRAFT_356673 [Emericellopsis atlantica]|uniref:BTB domain-containing protein n=1 Tax=Emericellopsis atlantica TaxID=2614577 RepID=A0A9P7ZEL1_9HYPO|nr:uncharacterized protein F5Z01DRAFT_356673 [Emericellopsis atlantica]KAG9250688.1 hypothetical protein F5Z01DRAFT_356673 [Emericellopsis atlantica]